MKRIETAYIIDDSRIYVFGLTKIIQTYKLCDNVMVFENGEKAIRYIADNITDKGALPEIIFLDINMPIMNGWDFLDEFIKLKDSIHKNIVIYMVSSSINPQDLERAKTYSEISEYIIKPIAISRLRELLTEA
ncbi:response regulator [Telluribacter sp.]|jgi:response regulator RpfG family c-di-GMP phosphodiesterase|uniref:response regulator n=1 Tax=Telluribacter sp. TaxID=1978767 RepID=UPI002E15021E|nr:response regulator [Telluribacter sp.]